MGIAAEAYRLGRLLPKAEEYRLTSQLLGAAASVPANIAEGHARGTRKDYAHFVSIARGSLAETETLLLLLADVDLLPNERVQAALELCSETGRMLNGLLARLRESPPP
jgi:four helix bundle protein